MAGRIGRGESWQFDELHAETSLRLNERLLYLDRFTIRPAHTALLKEWMMGNAPYLATGLCFDEGAVDLAERLHALSPAAGVDTPAPALTAARVVAASGPEFHRARAAFESLSGIQPRIPRVESA